MSRISPRADELVQIYFRSARTETPLFGPDLSKWPIWAVDTKVAIEIEKIREHNARNEAEANRD